VTRPRNLVLAALVLVALAAAAAAVGVTSAAFRGTTSNPTSSFSAKRVFPGTRTTASWTIRDAAGGGAETNADDPFAVTGDSRVKANGTNWATTFSATKYLELDYDSHLPAGLAASGVTFNFRIVGATTTDNICWYVATYVKSTGTLISDHGSGSATCAVNPASPATVSLSELTATDQVNDLTVRIYVRDATATRTTNVDVATVTGTYLSTAFTQNEISFNDFSSGASVRTAWSLWSDADTTSYTTANWGNSFSTSRYVRLVLGNLGIPTGATITAATLKFSYHAVSTTISWYCDVLSGGSTIGTHGSTTTPISSTASTTTPQADSVPLAEVNSVARANDVTVKAYMKSSTNNRAAVLDKVTLDVTWYLD
jgi:hypothetical protein